MNRTPYAPRVIIYCRVSSQQQATDDKSSHEYQERRCREACEARGYEVVQVLKEVDKRWELDRPELDKARQAIKGGQANILMAMVMDRLSSDTKHLYLILDDIERAGGRLEFADQEFEDTPEGRFLRSVATFMAELEILRIKARARQGHESSALAGLPVGRRPLGYQIDGVKKDRHYALEDAEVPLVRRIFQDVADGVEISQLIRDLEREGHKTSTGHDTWWPASIHRIIRNTVYRGTWRTKKTQTDQEKISGRLKTVTRKRSLEEQGPEFPCPRIVSDELWDQANARLNLNQAESPRNSARDPGKVVKPKTHLVRSPFGKCGVCGHALIAVPAKNGRTARYKCGNTAKGQCPGPSITQSRMDAEVWSRVGLVINSPGHALKKMVEQAHDGTLEAKVAELEITVSKLAKQVAGQSRGIARAWGNDDESLAEDLEAERKPLGEALVQAEQELIELQEQVRQQADLENLPSRLEQLWNEGSADFQNLNYDQKRNLLAKLHLKAELFPDLTGAPSSDGRGLSLGRARITMELTPDLLYGWNAEDDFWGFDPEEMVGEALNILHPRELSDEEQQQIAEAQARLTPEQRKANEDFLKLTPEKRHASIAKRSTGTGSRGRPPRRSAAWSSPVTRPPRRPPC
jgi:site-specific DNA recombinase